jgi:hypothetical protein
MSGVAATLILGDTTHRAVYLNQKRSIDSFQIEAWKDTILLIIDEVSFGKAADLQKLDYNLRILKENQYTTYGRLHIVLCGDMQQLPPIKAKPLYSSHCPHFHDANNTYIELRGMHHFRDDQIWGCRLL